MCRVRNTHTAPPWTTAYICVTVDDSCLDEQGKFVDKPMTVRMVQWQPYCVKKPFDPKTPVCAACKRTNRTRSFCRERHKHKQLPWCSVYVLLSTLESADPSTVIAGASRKVDGDEKVNGSDEKESADGDSKQKAEDGSISAAGGETITSDAGDPGDDVNDLAESKTFLAQVSCRSNTIHWLELSDFDSNEATPFPGVVPMEQQYHPVMQHPHHMMDPSHAAAYYQGPAMNYAAQQQQNALKSRQQYFFQMQQHHQYPPAGHWHQPPPPYAMAPPGQEPPHPSAGEAAAAQHRRIQDDGQHPPLHPQQQHWAAMYYQHPPGTHYPAPQADSNASDQMPPGGGDSAVAADAGGGDEEGDQQDAYHSPQPANAPVEDGEQEEQPDEKRQRLI
jgi:hypothetical protein